MPEASAYRIPPGSRVETPLCRLAQELAALSGWRRYGTALLLGALIAGALPPIDLTPLVFFCVPGLLWLDEGSATAWASARLGYMFGLGFFIAGLYWIAAALFVDIASFWWALPFALLGLPAYLAVYPALTLFLTTIAAARFRLSPLGRICLFAVIWTAAEWMRGHAFTGLPWNVLGYVWSGAFPGALAVLQSTAIFGVYGLTFVTVLAAALLALLGSATLSPVPLWRRWLPLGLTAALVVFPGLAGAVHLATHPSILTGSWLRLVQPSIAQNLKWDPAAADENLRWLLELSSSRASHPLSAVIWPEAAVPFLLERDAARRGAVAAVAPQDGYVLTGALRSDPPPQRAQQMWNSVEAVDRNGAIRGTYDKAHLVPFGEYMPYREILPFKKLTPGSTDLSAGPGPRTVHLSGLPSFSPLVCYEAIFPAAVVEPGERPAWLLNVTNDAWYGDTSGPYQHFAIARTRAVEEGLPLVRVANNGISGVFDAEGRVMARTGLNDVTYADIVLPGPEAATVYSRFGDWTLVILLLMGLVPAALRLR